MGRAEFAAHRDRLLALRAQLQGDVGHMTDAALSEDQSESPSMPTDTAEPGSYDGDREIALNLLDSEKDVLDQIEAALARIEDGSYGRCQKCGLGIPKARLDAVPYATLCVTCASQQERGRSP